MKKRLLNGLKWTFIYLTVTFALVEGLLWIMGHRPYRNHDYQVSSTPQNPYIADIVLGIRLNPGTFDFTLNKAVKFTATHQKNGLRTIPNSPENIESSMLFLGCSYTYGYGVNDAESFPAIIQSRHPEWYIENRAVVGYGTTQHLLQLRQRLKETSELPRPKCVLLCLSSVHFIRTVLSQQYRSNLRIGYRRSSNNVDDRMNGARFPYLDNTKGAVKHASWGTLYSEVPGRYWLASANFFQRILDRSREPDCDPITITAAIIREMQQRCAAQNIPFGVVCLNTTHETRQLERKVKDVSWKNIGFSFKNKKWTHLPHDSHPNATGHEKIASAVLPFIESLVRK